MGRYGARRRVLGGRGGSYELLITQMELSTLLNRYSSWGIAFAKQRRELFRNFPGGKISQDILVRHTLSHDALRLPG